MGQWLYCLGQPKSRQYPITKKNRSITMNCWRKRGQLLCSGLIGLVRQPTVHEVVRVDGLEANWLSQHSQSIGLRMFKGIITGKPWKTRVFTIKIIKNCGGTVNLCKFPTTSWMRDLCKHWIQQVLNAIQKTGGLWLWPRAVGLWN